MARSDPTAAAGDRTTSADFFVPDLCAPRAVFLVVLLAELAVLVHVLAMGALDRFDWAAFGKASFFVQWNVLLSSAVVCLLRTPLRGLSTALVTVLVLAAVGAVTLVSSLLAEYWLAMMVAGGATLGWVGRNVLVALLLAAIVLRYFYLQHQVVQQQRAELLARLDSLRARIRPHFLFNTLNSIASLIELRPRDAERAVEDVAELFRASLAEEREDATLADELRLCGLYLGIEKLRFGDRLRFEQRIEDDSLLTAAMPPLLLQPLLENAVYHGIGRLPAGGVVQLSATRCGDSLQVVISNPVPEDAGPGTGLHMALDNIRQRLEGIYDGRAALSAGRVDAGFEVCLRIPVGAP